MKTTQLKRVSAFGLVLGLTLLATTSPARGYPKPSVFPVSWQYKFESKAPKRIAVRTPGDPTAKGYWYVTFAITNKDIDDVSVKFLPVFEMLTRDGKVIRSEKGVPAAVYDEIRRREGNKGLEPLDKLRGRILLGEDQTRDGIAVWPEPEPKMGTFSLFFGGLSGETLYLDKDGKEVDVSDWTKFKDEDKKAFTVLRKTLEITYTVPGDELFPGEDPVNFVKQEWVMR